MIRWINSQLNVTLTDLAKDLDDGLVLIKLINKVITDIDVASSDLKLYLLSPLYQKPKFELQKLENVNDFLEFIRIVLKMNITGITSEHIVKGNLKMILGLIWSIFIFSTSNSIGILNDGNSIIEIKSILLNWVNKNFKLSTIANFNRDWSLEVNLPDRIFHSIFKNYLPTSKITKLGESKFQNLREIIQFAEELGIKKLADIEDFKTLVPDEKCVLFYLLEWYQFFELNIHGYNFFNKPVAIDLDGLAASRENFISSNSLGITTSSENPENYDDEEEEEDETYDSVVVKILDVVKSKYEYETKSLRFSNKINTINNKTHNILTGIKNNNFFGLLKYWEYQYGERIKEKMFTKEFKDLTNELIGEISSISKYLHNYEELNNVISQLTYHDIKQLEHIHKEISDDLKLLNENMTFFITRSLQLDKLQEKLDKLTIEQGRNNKKVKAFDESVLSNPVIKKINDYLTQLEEFLTATSQSKLSDQPDQSEYTDELLRQFDVLIGFIHKIDYSLRNLTITKSPKNLRHIKSDFNESLRESSNLKYDNFKQKLLQFDEQLIVNENEFKSVMLALTSINLNPSYIKSFINLIPLKIVNLNFNDSDFSLVVDDSDNDNETTGDSEIDNSNLIFEGSRRKISNQLGSDKIYDLTQFFTRFEDGLKL